MENQVENTEQVIEEVESQPEIKEQVENKTFTQSDVDSIVTKALENNNQKLAKYQQELEAIKQTQMTEEEKRQAEVQKQQDYVASLERQVQKSTIQSALAQNGLNLDPETFVNPTISTDTIIENINKLGEQAKLALRSQEVSETKTELAKSNNIVRSSADDSFANMTPEQKRAWGELGFGG